SLLILDNLETLWEPVESRNDIEEFLSMLADIQDLALIITMRGAERPDKVKWTRPFLMPLSPLTQDAAQKMFLDIADGSEDEIENVNKILAITDNLPLAINLLAHLVDHEDCRAVLACWEQDKTSMVSEGFDRRSNLDLSISLSLSSPRIVALPKSKQLLELLSILPDGLAMIDLQQSHIPLDIFQCKSALLQNTLAYVDEHNHLKVLVPIREYMQKHHPLDMNLVRLILHHFLQLLDIYHTTYDKNQSEHQTVARISANYANILGVLRKGLQPGGHSDKVELVNSIYGLCYLRYFGLVSGRGKIDLMDEVQGFLPDLCDHRLEVYLVVQLFSTIGHHISPDPNLLIENAYKHLEYVNDSDLKCHFYDALTHYYLGHKYDITAASHAAQNCLALATSTGNTKRQSQAWCRLAWVKWQLGEYHMGQKYAYESRRLARISGNLYREAQGLEMEASCWIAIGRYEQGVLLCNQGRELLALAGISGGDLDHTILTTQAEAHRLKSEYEAARKIHIYILKETPVEKDVYVHAAALMNIAELDICMDTEIEEAKGNLTQAKILFDMIQSPRLRQWCDVLEADLQLKEGHLLRAQKVFIDNLQFSWGKHNDIVSFCLAKLADFKYWKRGSKWTWTTVLTWNVLFLICSVKSTELLNIYKALLFLGKGFFAIEDPPTAVSLVETALAGFTQLDVHQSRAESMLWLGEYVYEHSNFSGAIEYWGRAMPLFQISSQMSDYVAVKNKVLKLKDNIDSCQ
ncbi:ATPase-AAA-core domain-containing protein, partial [Favolaschia claudopus]